MLPVHIRWMIRRDMRETLEIEGLSFEHGWAEEDFLRTLRQRNCIGMVSEHQEKVVGFMIYELHKKNLTILNFAVHPDYRRNRVGEQMIEKLKGKLTQQRRSSVNLVVRETNLPAQLFFKSCEFRARRVLRDHYDRTLGHEDGYFMTYNCETEMMLPQNRISKYMVP